MTRAQPGDEFDAKTCLCCMCRCGDHKCFQQMASKLPLSLQNELKSKEVDTLYRPDRKAKAYQADLYRTSTYKRDYCDERELIDKFPLEHNKLETHLMLHHGGDIPRETTYADDFIPWSREDQEMCRAKLHVPDYMLDRVPAYIHESAQKVPTGVYNYYCPPHCTGTRSEETKENCLTDYKEKFNIGPPTHYKAPAPDKPREPFEKFTNYTLDYRGGTISPRKEKRNVRYVEEIPRPMATETSYRSAFTCPPDNTFDHNPYEGRTDRDRRSTLKVGDGPMQGESTAMLDYQDPDVSAHQPTRPPRDVYKPPHCRMETTTTTGRAYPGWKNLPIQVEPRKYVETDYSKGQHDDIRRIVTTYQEDFEGLSSALCPCRVAEKYGPKYVEPRFRYTKSEGEHDFFCYKKKLSEPKYDYCPH